MTGAGLIANPWDLATALAHPSLEAGDTVYLRAGTYAGDFVSQLQGATIRNYPGERAIINGSLTILGNNSNLLGIEIYDAAFTARESAQSTDAPNDIGTLRTGLSVEASGVLVAGCVVHNTASGMGTGLANRFVENLIYHTGWKNPANAYGHALYMQNAAGTLEISRNIIIDQFGYGAHLWGSDQIGVQITDNVIANSGSLWGDRYFLNILLGMNLGHVVDGCAVTGNWLYFPGADGLNKLGYTVGGEAVGTVRNTRWTGNHIFGGETSLEQINCEASVVVADNSIDGTARYAVIAHTYLGLGRIVIYNPAGLDSVSVNVGAILQDGVSCKVKNAQDYFVDSQTLAVSGGLISVDMRAVSHTVATPQGWIAPATTFPAFGCFVLEPA